MYCIKARHERQPTAVGERKTKSASCRGRFSKDRGGHRPFPAGACPHCVLDHGGQRRASSADSRQLYRHGGHHGASAIFGSDGQINYALSAFMDISERKKFQAELKNLSIHDDLTGLLNRRGFITLAEQQQKIANRAQLPLLMLFIDLDGLKKVNDSRGHQAGDEMITEFAAILKEHFRKTDIVARMGGDEFAVLVSEKPREGKAIIERLRERVEARNAFSGHPYRLDFSLGSALYDPAKPCDLDQLISQSDERMYAEKKKKKNPSA